MLNLQTLLAIAHWISPRLKLDESGKFFELTAKFGQPAEFSMPIEILSLGMKMFSRGLYTALVYQTKTDWKWPYWLDRQSNPNDPAFQSVAHLIINQNRVFRNWTILGMPNQNQRMIVDPAMMMTPFRDGYSIEVWLEYNGKICCIGNTNQSEMKNRKMFERVFPKIKYQADYFETFNVVQEIVVSSIAGSSAGFSQLKILNTTSEKQKFNLFVSIRPYNVEGIAPIHSLQYDKKSKSWLVENSPALIFNIDQTSSFTGSDEKGDVWNLRSSSRASNSVNCPKGLANASSLFSFDISPHEHIDFDFVLPMTDKKKQEFVDWSDHSLFDFDKAKKRFENKWSRFTSDKMKISIPDQELQYLTEKCINYQSVFAQENQVTPGFFIYNDFWFRDSAYLMQVLLKTGQFQTVKNCLIEFPKHQNSDGFFESQEGEWDSNGEALWIVGQYFRYTQDKDLVLQLWPNLISAARWIQKKRLSHNSDKSMTGILPAGFSAEHFGQNDYYFWDDFWSLAGYEELLFLSVELKKQKEADWLKLEIENFRKTISDLLNENIRVNNGLMTASPKRKFDAGSVGVVAAISPLQILDQYHQSVFSTSEKILTGFLQHNCFYHPVAHTGINIYLTLQLRYLKIIRHDASIWNDLKSIKNLSSETGTWPEGIHPQFKTGVMGEGHHGWANSEWVNTVRDSLICDQKDELWITPVFNPEWLDFPSRISVQNTQTPFGKVSFQIVTDEEGIRLIWEPEFFKIPKMIRWFLPDLFKKDSRAKLSEGGWIEVSLPTKETHIELEKISHRSDYQTKQHSLA